MGTSLTIYRLAATFVMALAAAVVISNQARQLTQSLTEPFEFLASEAEPKIVPPGEALIVHYRFIRKRYCQTDLNLFIVTREHEDVVWRLRVPGGASLLGLADIRNTFMIGDLPENSYILRTIAFSSCADGMHGQAFPEVPFTIRKAPQP